MKISFFLVFALILSSGCGYKPSLFLKETSSIAVPIFENQTTYRGIEFELTNFVHNQIKSRTPFRLVAKPEYADLLIKGEIIDYQKPVSIEGRLDIVMASEVVITVKVTLLDQKTGKSILEKKYTSRNDLIPSRKEDEISARERIYENISQWVVSLLE
ncbi:MAG: LPS assembly lipoprotein LptE [Candidatus Brocadiia bacterium]